jgi:hypothetical protein
MFAEKSSRIKVISEQVGRSVTLILRDPAIAFSSRDRIIIGNAVPDLHSGVRVLGHKETTFEHLSAGSEYLVSAASRLRSLEFLIDKGGCESDPQAKIRHAIKLIELLAEAAKPDISTYNGKNELRPVSDERIKKLQDELGIINRFDIESSERH